MSKPSKAKMSIQEAITDGRPFRRSSMPEGINYYHGTDDIGEKSIVLRGGGEATDENVSFFTEDILANDWVVES
jgi:hypothetical protein